MKIPRKEDMPHKLALYRLLERLLSNAYIANNIYFKGGTCAAMLGYLDRFSVDLDFDLIDKNKKKELREQLYEIFKDLKYFIKDESAEHLQFFLKYRDIINKRNTLKLEISDLVSKKNKYKKVYLIEIDKYVQAQTIETMFANKLVALKARWEEGKGVAGRDMYDIYHFFKQGYDIEEDVIEDLRGTAFNSYMMELVEFIRKNVTKVVLMQDLNPLMPKVHLVQNISSIKTEVLIALESFV